MATELLIYIHRLEVGRLRLDGSGKMTFEYLESWLNRPNAMPISQSLPLSTEIFKQLECRGYFAGVLPDEGQRSIIASNLGIKKNNDFKMLEIIGGECAGAVTFIPAGEPLPDINPHYIDLDESRLAEFLQKLPHHPLLAGEQGIRLSLAGAQSKLAIHFADGRFSIPMGDAPSTHILKPDSSRFPGLIFNEHFCMSLAKAIGLEAPVTQIGIAENIPYLLIERYDRQVMNLQGEKEQIMRIHQEDFCQALGIIPELKYQNEGGPSLLKIFELLRSCSSAPAVDLIKLLDSVIFNFLVGNCDAHGKNFSLIYPVSKSGLYQTRFAPLYDLICTAAFSELSQKMAMKIGGEYELRKITSRNFVKLARESGLSPATVPKRVSDMASKILIHIEDIEISPEAKDVPDIIIARCNRALRLMN